MELKNLQHDEEQYRKLIGTLRHMPKVNAPANFEADLMRRIRQEEESPEKISFLKKLFSPFALTSSSIAVAAATIVLFVLFADKDDFNSYEEFNKPELIIQDTPSGETVNEKPDEIKPEAEKKEIIAAQAVTESNEVLSATTDEFASALVSKFSKAAVRIAASGKNDSNLTGELKAAPSARPGTKLLYKPAVKESETTKDTGNTEEDSVKINEVK